MLVTSYAPDLTIKLVSCPNFKWETGEKLIIPSDTSG